MKLCPFLIFHLFYRVGSNILLSIFNNSNKAQQAEKKIKVKSYGCHIQVRNLSYDYSWAKPCLAIRETTK